MGEGGDKLQLLHQWLTCDEAAGDQLWSDLNGLFEEYRVKGKQWGIAYICKLRRLGVRIEREKWDTLMEYEMECHAADQLAVIHDRLKPPGGGEGKKPEDFPSLDGFQNFTSKSLRKGIRDFIKDDLGLDNHLVESLDEPVPGTGGEAEEERALGETVANRGLTPEGVAIAEERRRLAAELLRAFRDYLDRRRPPVPALLSHFDTLVEAYTGGRDDIPLEAVAKEIIAFLEAPPWEHHPEIKRYFESKGVDESTYNSYNRRLRHQWRMFHEGPGKALYYRYEETR